MSVYFIHPLIVNINFFHMNLFFPLDSNQTVWRKANLASKLSIDNMEKQALLSGADSSLRNR